MPNGSPVPDPRDVTALDRSGPWAGVRVVVAGFGRAGFAAADNLLHLGADVLALDTPEQAGDEETEERAELLRVLGADVRIAPDAVEALPPADLVIACPEQAGSPLVAAARQQGLPVWGEAELAWRLRDTGPGSRPAPWLVIAGSAGTTEVATLVERMLLVAGQRPCVAGAAGLPLVEAVMDPEPYDALVLPLADEQLADVTSMSALAAVVLDGTGDVALRAAAYEHVQGACVYVTAEPATEELVREADVVEGARAIGITLGMPGVGMLGVVEDLLVERAYLPERSTSAAELASIGDLGPEGQVEPVAVTRALAAAALAMAVGVPAVAVRDALRAGSQP